MHGHYYKKLGGICNGDCRSNFGERVASRGSDNQREVVSVRKGLENHDFRSMCDKVFLAVYGFLFIISRLRIGFVLMTNI